jgi:transposase
MKKQVSGTHTSEEALHEISKFVKLIAGYVGVQQVEKLVTTDERKAIWFLCSGHLTREQIALESGVSLRTVTTFIDMAKTYGLVEEEKDKGGHAKRVIDYCPSEWKACIKEKKTKKTGQTQSVDTGLQTSSTEQIK